MRRLDPIIARFVDDVLDLAREVAAVRLRELRARPTGKQTRRPPARRPSRVTPPPSPPGEITDPQWLLAMGAVAPLEVAPPESPTESAPESASEGPASAVREVAGASPVRLRANETLARVSGAGVVIRRAR